MNEPFELTELTDAQVQTLTSDLAGDAWHTDGCTCDRRQRRRSIVDRFDDAELWACARCGGLYWRPTAKADHNAADASLVGETKPKADEWTEPLSAGFKSV